MGTKFKLFNGHEWGMIVLTTLGVAASAVPIAIISFGAFIKPLAMTYHWGRGEIGLALCFFSFAMAAAMPIAGAVIDRHGTRAPAALSMLLFSLGMFAMPSLVNAIGINGLYIAAAWIGVTGAASSPVVFMKIVSRRFERNRGLAMGFATSGLAIGTIVGPFLAVSIMQHANWEAAMRGLALLPLIVGIPVTLLVGGNVNRVPKDSDPRGTIYEHGMTLREALRTRVFNFLLIIFLIEALALHGAQLHLVALFSDHGFSPEQAAGAMSVMSIVMAFTRPTVGFILDRFFPPRVAAICFALAACGAVLLLLSSTPIQAKLFGVALFGIGAGTESGLLGLLVSRYFGMRAFAKIYGCIYSAFLVGSAIGPYFFGMLFDRTGSYASPLGWGAFGLVAASALLLTLPRFKPEDAPQRFAMVASE